MEVFSKSRNCWINLKCKTPYDVVPPVDRNEFFFLVREKEKFGYINLNGNPVIEILLDLGRPFYEGIAVVRQNEKWGLLNSNKEILWLEQDYNEISNCQAGMLITSNYKSIGREGYEYMEFQEFQEFLISEIQSGKYKDEWQYFKDIKQGVINIHGLEILKCNYHIPSAIFEYYLIYYDFKNDGFGSIGMGLIWKDGKFVLSDIGTPMVHFNKLIDADGDYFEIMESKKGYRRIDELKYKQLISKYDVNKNFYEQF